MLENVLVLDSALGLKWFTGTQATQYTAVGKSLTEYFVSTQFQEKCSGIDFASFETIIVGNNQGVGTQVVALLPLEVRSRIIAVGGSELDKGYRAAYQELGVEHFATRTTVRAYIKEHFASIDSSKAAFR